MLWVHLLTGGGGLHGFMHVNLSCVAPCYECSNYKVSWLDRWLFLCIHGKCVDDDALNEVHVSIERHLHFSQRQPRPLLPYTAARSRAL